MNHPNRHPISLGINLSHDGGCAVIAGGKVIAIAEERLTRNRYTKGWHTALAYCLRAADITLSDVDLIGLSGTGPSLTEDHARDLTRLGFPQSKVVFVDHHLSHAYGAFCGSGFDRAVVMVVDGAGNDRDTESFYVASREEGFRKVDGNSPERRRCGGIGATYEAFTNYIGFHEQEAGKTMALASFGDPGKYRESLFEVHGLRVHGKLNRSHAEGLDEFLKELGHEEFPGRHAKDSRDAMDLATWVQGETERVLIQLAAELQARVGELPLCFSGGVAMNCVANEKLRSSLNTPIFIPPAANDRGQALGNALCAMHQLLGEMPVYVEGGDNFGVSYSDDEVLLALRRHPFSGIAQPYPRRKFNYERISDPASVAAELVAQGNLIGWFQGGSELGARALGSRSILADPRDPHVQEKINSRIKRREWFRPFAPATLTSIAQEWFILDGVPSPHMLRAVPVVESKRSAIPGVTHVDGSARVQTTDSDHNPYFAELITRFGEMTGVPVVLNTSFNIQEPIVETPADAVATFASSSLDALVIGNYLVTPRETA